jgi:acyl-CoA thioester hydrolase
MGVVFNPNYFLYFDVAFTELWRDVGVTYAELMEAGVETAAVEATARFRSAARFDDELDIEAGVEQLGRTSLVTGYRVLRGDEVLCEGRLVHVFVSPATMGKVEIPESVRKALAPFADTSDGTEAAGGRDAIRGAGVAGPTAH